MVNQDAMGLVDSKELLRSILVFVGMILQGQPPKSILNLTVGGISR